MGVFAFAVLATVFGFVPTGLVALAYAGMAQCAHNDGDSRSALRRQALLWCWASVAVGVLVEAPVVAALALH